MSVVERLGISPEVAGKDSRGYSEAQDQTKDIFGFKWSKRDTYESEAVAKAHRQWLLERYCDNDPNIVVSMLDDGGTSKIILDAGCGSGWSGLLFFGDLLKRHDYLGVDISDSVEVARKRFQEKEIEADFIKASLSDLPFLPEGSVDLVFSEGVLHHTDSTERSLKYLATKIRKGGKFLFYVYAKKAVVREFTDDHIRAQLKDLPDEEAWGKLKPLTKLGQELGDLNIELDVPEDIDFLGIKKGKIDIQRFFYWNFCKLFYRPDYNLDEMNHINFDWFRPLNCHRHTPDEIQKWTTEAGMEIDHINIQPSGITVVATKL